MKKLLETINSPKDVKKLTLEELEQLASEIRQELIDTVSCTGGHLAPNLGTVELTLALHYVFDAPRDKIIWDVGHQAYTHKIITGRRTQFKNIRQYGGISGFPKRSESVYDPFGTGHASTSISAALGIAVGRCIRRSPGKVVAIIGDGSMTGGIAFEGLNHTGHLDKDLIVVLNDNEMSISRNVGALSSFLSRKLTTRTIVNMKKQIENFFNSFPGIGPNILQLIKRSEDSIKTFFTPGMLFEALKFTYIGPIKGHRIDRLIETFENILHLEGPILVHVCTQKGCGYSFAEKDPCRFHGIGAFDVNTGKSKTSLQAPPSYTKVFGQTMVRLGKSDEKIVAITAAMPQGTGLTDFAREFPERFFDVGIAEQHAVTFAAGLATENLKPVVAIYSTFLQRAFDQVIHDVCLQNLPVVFSMDRGGLVGEDGPTHHGTFDLSYLRHIPNMVLMAPKDENELQHMLYTAVQHDGPIALRYPRGKGVGVPLESKLREIPIGKAEVLKEGTDIAIVAIGATVYPALDAANELKFQGISATVVNARFVKPLDEELLVDLASRFPIMVTVEENVLQGGFGSAVLECLSDHGIVGCQVKRLGIPDKFIEHGSQKVLRSLCRIDKEAIVETVQELMKEHAQKQDAA